MTDFDTDDIEEAIYEMVAEEVARGEYKPGLQAKAIAHTLGDEQKAKAYYILLRARQIASQLATQKAAQEEAEARATAAAERQRQAEARAVAAKAEADRRAAEVTLQAQKRADEARAKLATLTAEINARREREGNRDNDRTASPKAILVAACCVGVIIIVKACL